VLVFVTAMLIDTHCHLDCEPLSGQLPQLLEEAQACGISQWVVPAIRPAGWQGVMELCRRFPAALPTVGIHPMAWVEATEDQLSRLDQLAPQAVAIGEIGLDSRLGELAAQETCFREQLRIARRHGLPVLIHCRGAIGRTLAILQQERADQLGGIMHAFSGSLESAREFIRLGFAISISATITYQGAVRPLRLARELPLSQLVLESDAPDLPPQAHRGSYNRPAWLLETARALAALKQMPLDELAAVTSATARAALRLDV
jgi:TatD DNase family protein